MTVSIVKLKWTRPETSTATYPNIWRTFKARDLDTDSLVEYHIQDLPESRFEDAIGHMLANYIKDEPVSQALGGSDDANHAADYEIIWRSAIAQKTALVCFKAGSDDIVGLNINFVSSKGEGFLEEVYKRSKSQITKDLIDMIALLYTDFDTFEHYGVNEYLSSFGLSVDRKYRGRGIGEQFLLSRKEFCQEFGIKISHTVFSSDFSNRLADKVGFKVDVALSYDEIYKAHPKYPLSDIKSSAIIIKTLVF